MLEDCCAFELTTHVDSRGSLTVFEAGKEHWFPIRRVYYLHSIPEHASRGGHAHKQLKQIIIAISGSFDLVLDDGTARKTFEMRGPSYGVYVCPMTWRDMKNFSDDAVCLVLASELYDESDYYRQYDEFLAAVNRGGRSA